MKKLLLVLLFPLLIGCKSVNINVGNGGTKYELKQKGSNTIGTQDTTKWNYYIKMQ